jgi:hypothetical protein
VFAEHIPITNAEFLAVAERRRDIAFHPTDPAVTAPVIDTDGEGVWLWMTAPGHADEPWWLHCRGGQAKTKNPEDWVVAHMLAIAAEFDAWVVGDDGSPYAMTATGPEMLPYDPTAFVHPELVLGYDGPTPRTLTADAWIRYAATLPGFEIRTWIEATVPSGRKVLDAPPTAYWTGHSSGLTVPYFLQFDELYVGADDPETRRHAETVGADLGMVPHSY